MSVTKPPVLDESYNDKMDELVAAIREVSIGNAVIISINNTRWGSCIGAGVYPIGASVTVQATPAENCYFLCWRDANGTILSTEQSYTFTPTTATALQAIFSDIAYIKTVSWEDGTDEELAAMIQAHYDGVINIFDYWSVGDTRKVLLSRIETVNIDGLEIPAQPEQYLEFVLLDTTLTGYEKYDENGEDLLFAVGTKDCLEVKNALTKNDNSQGLLCPLTPFGKWLETNFANALPQAFRQLFKKAKFKMVGTYESGSTSNVNETEATFFLPPVKNISNLNGKGSADEAALYNVFEYYSVAENRVKKLGIDGEATSYRTGSTYNNNYYEVNIIRSSGEVNTDTTYGNRSGAYANIVQGFI